MALLLNTLAIVFVNLILSGDNGVVIAVVMRSLPLPARTRTIMIAAACDVVVRTAATFFAAQLLRIWFLKLAGGILILWISVRLFKDGNFEMRRPQTLEGVWKPIWFIVATDFMMSTDNTLAIAAIAHGQFLPMLGGFSVSIPIVLFASRFLSGVIGRYSFLIYVGAGILGRMGGELIITDALVVNAFHPTTAWQHLVGWASALGVVTTGWLLYQQSP
jgi:YjbE family integral membrane protein